MTRPFLWIIAVVWLAAVAAGAWALHSYENSPTAKGNTPQQWPAASAISRSERPMLLLFAHPHCPCTKASVNELNRLLSRVTGPVETHILFIAPAGLPHEWTRTALWKSAAAIPGVAVHEDAGGAEARLFGAESSGHVVLYDKNGALQFSGGITSARGQAGDNAGENVLVDILNGQNANASRTSVFGCGLFNTRSSVTN